MSEIYFTSDLHFNHDKDFIYKSRGYHDVKEASESILKNINDLVKEDDTLYILGDIMLNDNEVGIKYFNQIKCNNIHIILGNHDKGSSNYAPYVDEIYEGPLFISPKILLSHEPIDIPFGINIHGHNHSGEIINRKDDDSFDYNVCSNVINYTPVRLDEIFTLAKTNDIHRLTIDKIK